MEKNCRTLMYTYNTYYVSGPRISEVRRPPGKPNDFPVKLHQHYLSSKNTVGPLNVCPIMEAILCVIKNNLFFLKSIFLPLYNYNNSSGTNSLFLLRLSLTQYL